MKMCQFERLPFKTKSSVLFQCGVYLDKIENQGYKLQLFQLDAFYIEVQYCKKKNRITHYKIFDTTDLLEPYLQGIDIKDVLQWLEKG